MTRTSLFLMALLCIPAFATGIQELSLDEVFASTEVAFLATVTSQRVEVRDERPWTVVEFDVERWLAGDTGSSRLELAFLGGERPGGAGLRVGLMPEFLLGETVLLLAYEEEFYSPIVGFNQGLWRVRDGALVDEQGRFLNLDEEGRLRRGEQPQDGDAVVDAVARDLEARR